MKFVSNLPDETHVPYKFIAAEPHFKKVLGYFRTSDYATIGAIGVGFPAIHALWERRSPSFHPKHLPRLMAIQVPFFLSVGVLFACQRSYCGREILRVFSRRNGRESKRREVLMELLREQTKCAGKAGTNDTRDADDMHLFSLDFGREVRFWGWSENSIEAARWEAETASNPVSDKPKSWSRGQDW
ncbi:UNVERIFIED_CONTAM: hypothetical protein HDU68_005705 [Siphonaria sp. JEL0065]|nr:hypothetical protein HDU68_005705 [Siphonaria sp. JEL0065]